MWRNRDAGKVAAYSQVTAVFIVPVLPQLVGPASCCFQRDPSYKGMRGQRSGDEAGELSTGQTHKIFTVILRRLIFSGKQWILFRGQMNDMVRSAPRKGRRRSLFTDTVCKRNRRGKI